MRNLIRLVCGAALAWFAAVIVWVCIAISCAGCRSANPQAPPVSPTTPKGTAPNPVEILQSHFIPSGAASMPAGTPSVRRNVPVREGGDVELRAVDAEIAELDTRMAFLAQRLEAAHARRRSLLSASAAK